MSTKKVVTVEKHCKLLKTDVMHSQNIIYGPVVAYGHKSCDHAHLCNSTMINGNQTAGCHYVGGNIQFWDE